jgi:hypothetical protein
VGRVGRRVERRVGRRVGRSWRRRVEAKSNKQVLEPLKQLVAVVRGIPACAGGGDPDPQHVPHRRSSRPRV